MRFDAKGLGYRTGHEYGSGEYAGSSIECYWYDRFYFNGEGEISENH